MSETMKRLDPSQRQVKVRMVYYDDPVYQKHRRSRSLKERERLRKEASKKQLVQTSRAAISSKRWLWPATTFSKRATAPFFPSSWDPRAQALSPSALPESPRPYKTTFMTVTGTSSFRPFPIPWAAAVPESDC